MSYTNDEINKLVDSFKLKIENSKINLIKYISDNIENEINQKFQTFNKDKNLNNPKIEFDSNGNIIREVLADGSIYNYDINGNVVKEVLPDRSVYFYDKNGNVTKEILPDGKHLNMI